MLSSSVHGQRQRLRTSSPQVDAEKTLVEAPPLSLRLKSDYPALQSSQLQCDSQTYDDVVFVVWSNDGSGL